MNNKKVLTQNQKTNYIFLLLLLGLLLLRFPFLISLCLNKIPITKNIGMDVFSVGTYLLTALLIILKRDSLSNYNIDFCALFILIVAPVARLLNEYFLTEHEATYMVPIGIWLQIIISICLLSVLFFYRPKVRKRKTKEILLWLFIAVAAGICWGILSGYLLSIQNGARFPNRPTALYVTSSFIRQLVNAAVLEEPLFRGFLWGYLQSILWKEHWIWLFQAALFMLGHIYYFGVYNYSLWIIVPVGGLIFGLLAWRSKSIGTSMTAHGLSNSIADIVSHFTW